MSAQTIIAIIASVASAVLAFLLGRRSGNNDGRADLERAGEQLETAESQLADSQRQNTDAQSELESVSAGLEQSTELADGASAELASATELAQRNEDLIAELRKRNQKSKST